MNSSKACQNSVELFEKLPDVLWSDLEGNDWENVGFICFEKKEKKGMYIKTEDFKQIVKWKITHVENNIYCMAYQVKDTLMKEVYYCIKDIIKNGYVYENALVRVQ